MGSKTIDGHTVTLVIPTIRENCFKDFVKRWKDIGLFEHVARFIVMEDNPTKTFDIRDTGVSADHFSWQDIDEDLTDRAWIVPRRSDTVRSYAYFRAWQDTLDEDYIDPTDYILTLDDDCYPPSRVDGLEYTGKAFLKGHIDAMEGRSKWFNTLNSVKPRGIPFYNVGESNVVLNHGLWTNVLDYDAPYQLANPIPEKFSFDSRVVPRGLYFPMCGMNVMWKREATVLMYHLLMGKRKSMLDGNPQADKDGLLKLPFDRFGDIWCGLFMKKVCDHLEWGVTTGMPYIRHERASNPFTNLRKEANGIEVNEDLWQHVDSLALKGTNPVECYREVGEYIKHFTLIPKYREHEEYFALLSKAMIEWANLFAEDPLE